MILSPACLLMALSDRRRYSHPFPFLGHDVANINFRRFTVSDRFDDIRDAQIGHDARIEAPRPQNDGIGTF